MSILMMLTFIISCSPARYVPQDKYLLNSVNISSDNKEIDKDELNAYVKQKPNKRVLRMFRFYLWIYNRVDPMKAEKRAKKHSEKMDVKNEKRRLKGKEPKEGFNFSAWIQEIGEEPVIYDEYLTEKTRKQFEKYLKNKGYYNASVQDSVILVAKRAFVRYIVDAKKPFLITNIDYSIDDFQINDIVLSDTANSKIKIGRPFDIDVLQSERKRITRLLQKQGYYYFQKEFISFSADSSKGSNSINVELKVRKPVDTESVIQNHKKYKIGDIYVYMDYDPKKALKNSQQYIESFDTTNYNGTYFINSTGFVNVKPKVIMQTIYCDKDSLYNIVKVEETYRHLAALNNFKLINIKFTEKKDKNDELNCHVYLTPDMKQSTSQEIVGTNSKGNFGIGGNVTYQHKSLFGGAEIFELRFKGAIANEPVLSKDENKLQQYLPFNTSEIGVEASLKTPKFLLPFRNEQFIKKYQPKTSLSIGYNQQYRPEFNKKVTNSSFGYYWDLSPNIKTVFNPVEVYSIKANIDSTSNLFQRIKGSYLESSYRDVFISESNLSLVFNNQVVNKKKNFVYFRIDLEAAGNTLRGISNLSNASMTDSSYTIFNTKFAQYIKSDIDYRQYFYLRGESSLVYRLFAGTAYAYGNLDVIPFVKQYYSGGANGIRAWQVLTLGPGSYKGGSGIPNQSADFKLEANLEYRFKMFWMLEGALFIDAGNIWSLNEKDERNNSVFELNRFHKEIAVGVGYGTRLDFSFFVLRFDIGMKVRDPAEDEGSRVIITNRKLTNRDFAFNVGIGYPF